MLSGKVLYRDVFDHKGPVLYLLYGLGVAAGPHGLYRRICAGNLRLRGVSRPWPVTAELLRSKPLHPVWCLVPAAAVGGLPAFSHGGSAEELLLPFLAAALYGWSSA